MSLGLSGGEKVAPPSHPASGSSPSQDPSLTLSTCSLMSEGTMRIIITPSAAHSSPRTPSPKATQRALELTPMSACAAESRWAQDLKGTAIEATEATEMTETEAPSAARCVPDGGQRSSSPAGGQRFYAPWPGQPAPVFGAGFRRGVGKGGEWAVL